MYTGIIMNIIGPYRFKKLFPVSYTVCTAVVSFVTITIPTIIAVLRLRDKFQDGYPYYNKLETGIVCAKTVVNIMQIYRAFKQNIKIST